MTQFRVVITTNCKLLTYFTNVSYIVGNEKARSLLFQYIEPVQYTLRVFENRVLRRMSGSKRDEVTGAWRKLDDEELHNLYSSPSVIRIIKARRMSWAGHVARMGRRGMHIGFWWESQKERDQ
jgi:hypothetical protein